MRNWLSTAPVYVLHYCPVVVLQLPVRGYLTALEKYCQIICMMTMFSTVPELLRCVQLVQYFASSCAILLYSIQYFLTALGKYWEIICMITMVSTVFELWRCAHLAQYFASNCAILLYCI